MSRQSASMRLWIPDVSPKAGCGSHRRTFEQFAAAIAHDVQDGAEFLAGQLRRGLESR